MSEAIESFNQAREGLISRLREIEEEAERIRGLLGRKDRHGINKGWVACKADSRTGKKIMGFMRRSGEEVSSMEIKQGIRGVKSGRVAGAVCSLMKQGYLDRVKVGVYRLAVVSNMDREKES